MELHLISTSKQTKHELVSILEKVHFYTDYIHLREKQFNFNDYLETINMLAHVGVPLEKIIINDKADIAYRTQAGGVQLRGDSLPVKKVKHMYPKLKIGCSVHETTEALMKERDGADYLVYGHVFSTASKPNLAPKGLSALKKVSDSVTVPVIAIGGIKPSNVNQVKQSGASGIAVLSGVLLADDPLAAVKEYHHAMKEGT